MDDVRNCMFCKMPPRVRRFDDNDMRIVCMSCGTEIRNYPEKAIQCWNALNEPRAHEECHPKTIEYEDYMESDVCSECGRSLDGNGFQARFCSWCGRKVVRP